MLIELPATASFTTLTTIRQILTFTQWLRSQPGVTTVHSPWEALRRIGPELRHRDDQLSVVATLLSMALPLQAWLDGPRHTLRVSVRMMAMRSDQLLLLAQHIAQHATQEQLAVQVTGSNFLLAQMSRTLVQTQICFLVLASLSIFGSIVLVLRSWKLEILAVPPNFLPPLMIFGLMGWGGIALSTATTMIASVALGLIVDNTIHLLYRYTRQRTAGVEPSAAVAHALRHTGRAAIFSTLILTLGYGQE